MRYVLSLAFWRKCLSVQREKVESEKIPLHCVSFPYLYEREWTVSLPSCLMIVSVVIITFLLLPSVICRVVISLRWAALPLTLG